MLTYDRSHVLAQAALRHSTALGAPAAVVIADTAGNLVYSARTDGGTHLLDAYAFLAANVRVPQIAVPHIAQDAAAFTAATTIPSWTHNELDQSSSIGALAVTTPGRDTTLAVIGRAEQDLRDFDTRYRQTMTA